MIFKSKANKQLYEKHVLEQLQILEEQLQYVMFSSLAADERTVKTNEIIVRIDELLLELECLGWNQLFYSIYFWTLFVYGSVEINRIHSYYIENDR